MPPRTSGNTCARPISRTASSKTTTRSSPPAARLGAGSKPKPAAFDRSLREAGQASVRLNEGWYKFVFAGSRLRSTVPEAVECGSGRGEPGDGAYDERSNDHA